VTRRIPHRLTFKRALALAVLGAACAGGAPDGERARPEPWARLTGSCPSLEGTYALVAMVPPFSQTDLGALAGDRGRQYPWETMTIAGDPDDSLVITLARSEAQRAEYRAALGDRDEFYARQFRELQRPAIRWSSGFATMTDSAYEANFWQLTLPPTQRHVLTRRSHYRCTRGWVRFDRVVHDPGPDPMNPRPDTVIGEVLLRRGEKGSLLARADYKDEKELTLWCGDGCRGIELGTWGARQWGRWPSAAPASDGVVARPWAEPFEPPPIRSATNAPAIAPLTAPDSIASALRPLLPEGVQLQSVERDGDGYRALIASRNTTPFTQLMTAVRGAYRFRHEGVVGLTRAPEGEWLLALALGDIWTDSPANPHDPTRALFQALPTGVTWAGTRGAGKGLEVTLVSKEQGPMDDAVRAIEALDAYEEVRVKSSIRSAYDQSIVTIVYVREQARP